MKVLTLPDVLIDRSVPNRMSICLLTDLHALLGRLAELPSSGVEWSGD